MGERQSLQSSALVPVECCGSKHNVELNVLKSSDIARSLRRGHQKTSTRLR